MWIVIEALGGPEYAIVCADMDGTNYVFYSEESASKFAKEECQNGIVVQVL